MPVRLISPSAEFESSYRSFVAEVQSCGEKPIPFPLGFAYSKFADLLARLEENAKGRGLPDGFVAHSSYWLVSDAEIVGISNLRHALTPSLRTEGGNIGYGVRPSARRKGFGTELLRRTLSKAGGLGLSKLLLTCGKQNIGSIRVILANGGALESEEYLEERGETVQRYWIDLARVPPLR